LPCATGQTRTSGRSFDRIGLIACARRFANNYPLNSNKIGNAVQVSLRIFREIIIENNENISGSSGEAEDS